MIISELQGVIKFIVHIREEFAIISKQELAKDATKEETAYYYLKKFYLQKLNEILNGGIWDSIVSCEDMKKVLVKSYNRRFDTNETLKSDLSPEKREEITLLQNIFVSLVQ